MAPVETVSFATRGVVLVTGPAERVLSVLDRLPAPLRVVAFVPDAGGVDVARSGARIVAAPTTAVSGHLGQFSASTVPVDGARVDAGRFSWNEDRRFDFVLDLNEMPLLMHEVLPLGYFAPRDAVALTEAIERIRTQPTSLRKPRYFAYEAARCTHGAAGITGCTRCLDACPAGAVTSAGEKVRFDPFLCQGCGTCTAVCPDGAVRYAYPVAETMLETLQKMLGAWREATDTPPRLVVARSDSTVALAEAADTLPFPVQALAAFGIESWFAALAWGASQVVLAADAVDSMSTLGALRDEIAVAHGGPVKEAGRGGGTA